MVYRIKLEQFEGPLDLLLQLIEQQKLDITRVSLANVTDQYLEYINGKENISLENLSEFLSVASKLILIKSKALLPMLEFTEEEEEEIKELEHQLEEYKKFKEIAVKLGVLTDRNCIAYGRENVAFKQPIFCAPEELITDELFKAINNLLGTLVKEEKLEEEMIKEVLTLEEKIVHLQDILREKVQTTFHKIISDATDKVEVVVSFLAMLELVKQKIIHVEQNELFSEILLETKRNEIDKNN